MIEKNKIQELIPSNNQEKGGAEMEEQITLNRYTCERCSHKWLPRSEDKPTVCPRCKSPYWNNPRQETSSSENNNAKQ
jgi:predicted Zn-ribbon and HTH transcriptional regulator